MRARKGPCVISSSKRSNCRKVRITSKRAALCSLFMFVSSGSQCGHIHSDAFSLQQLRLPRHDAGLLLRTVTRAAVAGEGESQGNQGQLETENVVIIGSGPAGYTAAVYCGRANLKPLVILFTLLQFVTNSDCPCHNALEILHMCIF